jgi:hypothetical protein
MTVVTTARRTANMLSPLDNLRGDADSQGMHTPLSDGDLRRAQRAFERAETRTAQTRAHRDELVAAALAAGWSHARIARATGLTRGRIGQIASRSKGTP